jgi:hypothetical protein
MVGYLLGEKMKKIVLLAALISVSAFAQQDYPRDITLSWTNPSQYVDGSVIDAGDLDSIRVECFRGSETTATFTSTVADTGEGAAQTETYPGVIPNPGTYTCFAYAIVVDGTESDASNSAERKYIGKPLPPQTFN